MYSTCLHVYTRAPLTDILARILTRKSARVGRIGGQVGEDCRACPARGKLNGEVAGHADILATILARKLARMSVSVSVSVSVPWNFSFNALRAYAYPGITGYGTSLQYFANQIDLLALKFEYSYKYIRSLCVLSVVDVTAYIRAQLLNPYVAIGGVFYPPDPLFILLL